MRSANLLLPIVALTMLTFCDASLALSIAGPPDVRFEPGEPKTIGYHLTEKATAELQDIAKDLLAQPEASIHILAFTDNHECATFTVCTKLAERRAKVVYDWLSKHGVSASRMFHGPAFLPEGAIDFSKPADEFDRRVEIQFYYPAAK